MQRTSRARVAAATSVPLLVAASVLALWWLSDRLLMIGPFDRATFGWGVVVPIWLATPVAAAFAWRGLDDDARRIAAIAVGLVVGVAAMLLALPPDADPACQFGAIPRPGTWIPPVLIGAVLGGGVAASSLAGANRVADGHTPSGIVIGVGTQAAAMALALLLTIGLFMGPVCERPPV